jgi:hypothetical protein
VLEYVPVKSAFVFETVYWRQSFADEEGRFLGFGIVQEREEVCVDSTLEESMLFPTLLLAKVDVFRYSYLTNKNEERN